MWDNKYPTNLLATYLEKAGVRNDEVLAFYKRVVPLTAKKTVPTWGGSVFFARPIFEVK